jgi:hypothetical protein
MTNERGILRVQTSKETPLKKILANPPEPISPRYIENAMQEQCRDDQTVIESVSIG